MSQDERPSGGVLESFRKLCDAGLAQVQNRIELFSVEMQEEKARLEVLDLNDMIFSSPSLKVCGANVLNF